MKILLLCASIVLASCGSLDCKDPKNSGSAKCAIENAVVDCTTSVAKGFVAQHLSDLSVFFTSSGIDWTAIEHELTNLVLPEAICVLETAWNNYTAAPASTALRLRDTSSDLAIKNALETRLWPGKSAKLR